MRLTLDFRSLADWEPIARGEALMKQLKLAGFEVEKAGSSEPVRLEYTEETVRAVWPSISLPGKSSTGYFLFKGKRPFRFSGMVIWNKNLPPASTLFNYLSLNLTVDKRWLAQADRLIELGDRLFEWSGAVNGFITLAELHDPLARPPAQRMYLPGVYWVNYFGHDYCNRPGFRLPESAVALSSGVRVVLGSGPDDLGLADTNGLLHSVKSEIGLGWFGEGDSSQFQIPPFDFSALRRTEVSNP